MKSARELNMYREKKIESVANNMMKKAWEYLGEKVNEEMKKEFTEFFENQSIKINKEEMDSRMEKVLIWGNFPRFADTTRRKAKRLLEDNLRDRGWELKLVEVSVEKNDEEKTEKYWALCPLPDEK